MTDSPNALIKCKLWKIVSHHASKTLCRTSWKTRKNHQKHVYAQLPRDEHDKTKMYVFIFAKKRTFSLFFTNSKFISFPTFSKKNSIKKKCENNSRIENIYIPLVISWSARQFCNWADSVQNSATPPTFKCYVQLDRSTDDTIFHFSREASWKMNFVVVPIDFLNSSSTTTLHNFPWFISSSFSLPPTSPLPFVVCCLL